MNHEYRPPAPVIRWSGSKRNRISELSEFIPKDMETYYEPFLGSGAVMRFVLDRGVKNAVCGDICMPLMLLWKEIRDNPEKLSAAYAAWQISLEKDWNAYYIARRVFNADQDNPAAFLFLIRTCVNGIIRFNGKGNFNSSLHLTRKGLKPEAMSKILADWSKAIASVRFYAGKYSEILPCENDFCFLDPPYVNSGDIYYGYFNEEEFLKWVKGLPCPYVMTYDGQASHEKNMEIRDFLQCGHKYLESRKSRIARVLKRCEKEYNESVFYKL